MRTLIILSLLSTGCKTEESEAKLKEIEETEEEPSDEEVEEEDCDISIAGTVPSTGSVGWYYRDAVSLTFTDNNPDISLTLTDSSGAEQSVTYEWDDVRLNATVMHGDGMWSASETYSLEIAVCGNTPTITFGISDVGTPLEMPNEDLVGNTYFVDLSAANYTEPPGVGVLLGIYLDMPLLLNVKAIDGDRIDFEANLGVWDAIEGMWGLSGMEPWLFEDADFSGSPFFEANTELLNIPYGEGENIVYIPVHGFEINGTFSSGGESILNANFTGIGDTSELGLLMGLGNSPEAVCELLVEYGVDCLQCPEGDSTTCVRLTGEITEAEAINVLD